MKLLSRTTRPADLEQCLAMIPERCLYDDSSLKALRRMWFDLIVHDVARSAIVFAPEQPERVIAFGFAAPVERQTFDAVRAGCEPFIARRMLEEWRAGSNPFLDEPRFAEANGSGGVNLFGFPLGFDGGLVDTSNSEAARGVFSAMADAFARAHAGLNVATFAQELFGWFPDLALKSGIAICFDYPLYEDLLARVPSDRRPFTICQTREEVLAQPLHVWTSVFSRSAAPRFALAADSRRLLRFALEGEADSTIASILAVSSATLKKRWLSIYQKMASVLPENISPDRCHRGAESRRHILRYVLQHPEELHPWVATSCNR